MQRKQNPILALVLASAFAGSLAALPASAADNPFAAARSAGSYQVAAAEETMKCGTGKCGAAMMGDSQKAEPGKTTAEKPAKTKAAKAKAKTAGKPAEAKCGGAPK